MTLKKKTTKAKTAQKRTQKEEVPTLVDISSIPPIPVLREALICVVDSPARWGRLQMAMVALPRIARLAATLCQGTKCFFCGEAQAPVPKETLFMFHPEYPLCACLAKFRKMAFDYIPRWEFAEGKKAILDQVEAGTIALDTPVYQFFCQCGTGPVVVDVRSVAYGLRTYRMHSRRKLCNTCYNAVKRPQAAKSKIVAHRPKHDPGARINKVRHEKPNKRLISESLPPVDAILSEQQLVEMDRKALETLNQVR